MTQVDQDLLSIVETLRALYKAMDVLTSDPNLRSRIDLISECREKIEAWERYRYAYVVMTYPDHIKHWGCA